MYASPGLNELKRLWCNGLYVILSLVLTIACRVLGTEPSGISYKDAHVFVAPTSIISRGI